MSGGEEDSFMSEVVTQLRIPSETNDWGTGVKVAVVEGAGDDGGPLVRWGPGRPQACLVRSIWMANPPEWSACRGLRVVLGFEDGDEAKPILLGLLDSPPEIEERPAEPLTEAEEPAEAPKPKVLRIESEQELILECGQAKIALRADGRVVILGGYLLSRSKGVNKIKGGSVQIN